VIFDHLTLYFGRRILIYLLACPALLLVVVVTMRWRRMRNWERMTEMYDMGSGYSASGQAKQACLFTSRQNDVRMSENKMIEEERRASKQASDG